MDNMNLILRDHIFTLSILLEKCKEKTNDGGLILIDLEKAYNSVPRKPIQLLKSIYSRKMCQIKVRNCLSRIIYNNKELL